MKQETIQKLQELQNQLKLKKELVDKLQTTQLDVESLMAVKTKDFDNKLQNGEVSINLTLPIKDATGNDKNTIYAPITDIDALLLLLNYQQKQLEAEIAEIEYAISIL